MATVGVKVLKILIILLGCDFNVKFLVCLLRIVVRLLNRVLNIMHSCDSCNDGLMTGLARRRKRH